MDPARATIPLPPARQGGAAPAGNSGYTETRNRLKMQPKRPVSAAYIALLATSHRIVFLTVLPLQKPPVFLKISKLPATTAVRVSDPTKHGISWRKIIRLRRNPHPKQAKTLCAWPVLSTRAHSVQCLPRPTAQPQKKSRPIG